MFVTTMLSWSDNYWLFCSTSSAFRRKAAVVASTLHLNAFLHLMLHPLWYSAHWALWPRCDEGESKLLLTRQCRCRDHDLDRPNGGKKKKAATHVNVLMKNATIKATTEVVVHRHTALRSLPEKKFCNMTFTCVFRLNNLSWRHKVLSALRRFADQRRPVGGA